MGKFDSMIKEAKVVLTEVSINAFNFNTSNNLKLKKSYKEISELIPFFEQKSTQSIFIKFKDAMFDSEEDNVLIEKEKDFVNKIQQLNICLQCKCASCPLVEEKCLCEGCMPGASVINCPGGNGKETRQISSNFPIRLNNEKIIELSYDRQTGVTTATTIDYKDIKKEYYVDLKTGESLIV